MNKTLAIIKPDTALNPKVIGEVFRRIGEVNFTIVAMRLAQITSKQAEKLYSYHYGREYYKPNLDFITGGPSIQLVLEGDEAVLKWRALMGPVQDAPVGTIRGDFASSVTCNCVHGSSSEEEAAREIHIFFPDAVDDSYKQYEPLHRPHLDEYGMLFALTASVMGTCNRAKVGAVAVKGGRVLAIGYNGAPAGVQHCDEVNHHMTPDGRCGHAVHSEVNVVANAARHGISLDGATVYCLMSPCVNCAGVLINAGVKKVVFSGSYNKELFYYRIIPLFEQAGVRWYRLNDSNINTIRLLLEEMSSRMIGQDYISTKE